MPTNPAGIAISPARAGRSVTARADHVEFGVREELAARRLEELHTARGDWAELARLHIARAQSMVEPRDRAAALCRAASLYRTRLGDGGAALALLRRAFSTSPDDPAVAAELEAAARASAAVAAEVRALYVGAARQSEPGAPQLSAELWLRAALLDAAVRCDAVAAVEDLEHVSEPVTGRAASLLDRIERQAGASAVLDGLALLCHRTGDRAREKRALLRSLERAVEACDRAARHHAIAALDAAEGDQEAAAWHLREAMRLDPAAAGAESGFPAPAAPTAAASPPSGSSSLRPAMPFRVPLPESPEQDRAALPLAERYWRDRRWHELEPLLDRLLRRGAATGEVGGDDMQPIRPPELLYRAGHVALELGNWDKAYRFFRETLALDPAHLPALAERALAASGLGRWDEAHELYGAALRVQRGLGRPPGELAETLFRMGYAREKGGHPDAALTLYAGALELQPGHRRALAAACRRQRAAGDLRAVDRLLRAALPHAARGRQVAILIELAGLASRCFGDPLTAVALTRQAMSLAPGQRGLLLPLVEHCHAAGQGREAIEALTRLAEEESDALRRGRYFHLAGALAGNVSAEEAVDYLERALDSYFAPARQAPDTIRASCLRAFHEIEALLRARGGWKRLEQAYLAMIERLDPAAPELPALWYELGRIYREHLGEPASATQSFDVSAALERERLTRDRSLIDLYRGAGADEVDKLIERRRCLLAAEPFNGEHYAALRSLFVKSRNRDGILCACQALVFLGRADRDEDEFWRRHRPSGVTWPDRPLTAVDWRRLRHLDEDPLVGAVLALVAEPAALARATTAWRLRLRNRRSTALDHVRALYRSACAAFGEVGEPDLFVLPELEADMVLANLRRGSALAPAFVIGWPMYQARTNTEMVHTMGRALSYARPAAYLRLLFGPSARVAAAFAAACAVGGSPTDGAAAENVAQLVDALRSRADGAWLSELRAAVGRVRERGGNVDVARFCRAVDATARRAGLLLGGSLEVAASDLHREPTFALRRPCEERLADLLVHSVSGDYLALRRDLRLGLGEEAVS